MIIKIKLLDGSLRAYQMAYRGCSRIPACQIAEMIRSPFLQGAGRGGSEIKMDNLEMPKTNDLGWARDPELIE